MAYSFHGLSSSCCDVNMHSSLILAMSSENCGITYRTSWQASSDAFMPSEPENKLQWATGYVRVWCVWEEIQTGDCWFKTMAPLKEDSVDASTALAVRTGEHLSLTEEQRTELQDFHRGKMHVALLPTRFLESLIDRCLLHHLPSIFLSPLLSGFSDDCVTNHLLEPLYNYIYIKASCPCDQAFRKCFPLFLSNNYPSLLVRLLTVRYCVGWHTAVAVKTVFVLVTKTAFL